MSYLLILRTFLPLTFSETNFDDAAAVSFPIIVILYNDLRLFKSPHSGLIQNANRDSTRSGFETTSNMYLFDTKMMLLLRQFDCKLGSFARFTADLYLTTVELNNLLSYRKT